MRGYLPAFCHLAGRSAREFLREVCTAPSSYGHIVDPAHSMLRLRQQTGVSSKHQASMRLLGPARLCGLVRCERAPAFLRQESEKSTMQTKGRLNNQPHPVLVAARPGRSAVAGEEKAALRTG